MSNISDSPKVKFFQFHQPGLKDGFYQIKIDQKVETDSSRDDQKISKTFSTTKYFAVYGDAYQL